MQKEPKAGRSSFTLVADVLNMMISKAREEGILQGLAASNNIAITNLQYTDDTIIFGTYSITQAIIIKCTEIWSELKVNYHKSHILFLGDHDIGMMITEKIMGCLRGNSPFTYLGILLREGKLGRQDWSVIIEKASEKVIGKRILFQ